MTVNKKEAIKNIRKVIAEFEELKKTSDIPEFWEEVILERKNIIADLDKFFGDNF